MASTIIFSGGFGSGKSEIALNFTLEKKGEDNRETILADLDLVNPYFASREMKGFLQARGIRVLAPAGELVFGDVPSIPSEIIGLLQQENRIIIDLAGDEVGAVVLGYIRDYLLKRKDLEFFLVINPYRPFAGDVESIKELKNCLEKASGLNFTGIISNPNLVEETTVQVINDGHNKVLQYAEELNLPVRYLTVEERFYEELVVYYPQLLKKIKINLRPQWI
ncbi:Chromosome partitioning ATPase, Mrp family, contains Fe-S cluster [Thermosyntropha lipolytica DSM 11003]|uniref:Chromosome partitioning ATPase, Mrp family, contains Fe-S cluster n=1 Tax=Thermosyntropha lipolytica DSM 11003 TaxID=1123382 RepID=A0A1M5Q896_9FIRM|nr:hypothetical protein [Thermosyntropha lipolytica]SHH10394.1 Chromosome partitioning ATPase, Mrp family, contains Fe-S cluster [Thermosyntropha lipolytica DSM 11003]